MHYRIGEWTYERGNLRNLLSGSRCWMELKWWRADWLSLPARSFCTPLLSFRLLRVASLTFSLLFLTSYKLCGFMTESPPFSCFGWIAGKFFSFTVPRPFFPLTLVSSWLSWSCHSTLLQKKNVSSFELVQWLLNNVKATDDVITLV